MNKLELYNYYGSKQRHLYFNKNTNVVVYITTKNEKILVDARYEELMKKYTWYVSGNGYATRNISLKSGVRKQEYLHSIIMKDVNKTDVNQTSIDHINRIKTDNRLCNLRWATQSEQNMNTDKRKRKTSARELPDEIKDVVLPKYVVYYYDKTTEQHFFTIEKHPALGNKRPKTTKSKKVDLLSKLEEAKSMLRDFDLQMPDDIKNMDKLRQERLEEYDDIMKLVPNDHDTS